MQAAPGIPLAVLVRVFHGLTEPARSPSRPPPDHFLGPVSMGGRERERAGADSTQVETELTDISHLFSLESGYSFQKSVAKRFCRGMIVGCTAGEN